MSHRVLVTGVLSCAVLLLVAICAGGAFATTFLLPGDGIFSGQFSVSPVPFVPNDRNADTGTWGGGITFYYSGEDNLELVIYTLAGEKVFEATMMGGWKNVWLVINEDGERLAAGTYLYVATNGSTQYSGKLVIIT